MGWFWGDSQTTFTAMGGRGEFLKCQRYQINLAMLKLPTREEGVKKA